MSAPLVLLLASLVPAPAGERWFYPGPGPERAVLTDGRVIDQPGTGPMLGGVPVRLTGAVLVEADDPDGLAGQPGVREVRVLPGSGRVARLELDPGVDPVATSRALHDGGLVRWAHPNLALRLVAHQPGAPHRSPRASLADPDPLLAEQWHLENLGQRGLTPGVDVGARTAWAITRGAGQRIAVIDTGVDPTHPDLVVVAGTDYVGGDDDPSPDPADSGVGHGTAVAGLAAAAGDNGLGVAGVAPEADVYAIRLIGGVADLEDTYRAFVEAVDAGATVLNNSWGFGDGCSEFLALGSVLAGIDYAEESGREGLGSAFVASAGNGNCDISNDTFQRHPSVISVAATDGNDRKEGYSSWGELVDVAAPAGVLTTDVVGQVGYEPWNGDANYTGWFSGTSASAPIVSGVLALMFAANDRLTAAAAREVLCQTAAKNDLAGGEYDDEGRSVFYGCGRVDAGAAVAAVANAAPGVPVVSGPPPEVQDGRQILSWDAEDPDGDQLRYRVRYWPRNQPEREVSLLVDEPRLDLRGEIAAGDAITWTVRAVDLWGPGETTAEQSFVVVRLPAVVAVRPAVGGCAVAPGTPALALAGILALGLRARLHVRASGRARLRR